MATLFPFNLFKQQEGMCKQYCPLNINKCCLPLPLPIQVSPQSGPQSVLSDDFTRSAYRATVYLFLPCEHRMAFKTSITDTPFAENGFFKVHLSGDSAVRFSGLSQAQMEEE